MKKFYVDFSGYCEIEAENEDEALDKFWDIVNADEPLPHNYYETFGAEEIIA